MDIAYCHLHLIVIINYKQADLKTAIGIFGPFGWIFAKQCFDVVERCMLAIVEAAEKEIVLFL